MTQVHRRSYGELESEHTDAHLKQALAVIQERLSAYYGHPRNDARSDATEELVRTILSQNTNDINRDNAFAAMRLRFPSWEMVATVTPSDLAAVIRPGGLAETKAPRIQNALKQIRDRTGSYDLSFVCQMATPEAINWLTSLPGVGPKTAACVLLFSCGQPVFPVDTHILRVTTRLGLLPEGTSAEAAHRILGAAVAPEDVYPLHINLIRHGRLVCRAQKPRCPECVLSNVCLFPAKST